MEASKNFLKIIIFGLFFLLSAQTVLSADTDIDLSELEKITAESAGDNAGVDVSGIGDINGDGYEDFLVSAHKDDDGGEDAGAVYLFYGQEDQDCFISLSTTQ